MDKTIANDIVCTSTGTKYFFKIVQKDIGNRHMTFTTTGKNEVGNYTFNTFYFGRFTDSE